MIVRVVLWRLDESTIAFDELRNRLDELEPLDAPSMLLGNEAGERIGVLLVADDDEPPPPQLDALRGLIGRAPDLYEEFDAL